MRLTYLFPLFVSLGLALVSCGDDSSGSGNTNPEGTVDPVLLGTWYEVNVQGNWDPDTLIFTEDSLGGSGIRLTSTMSSFYAEKGNIGFVWNGGKSVFYEYKISNDTLYTEFQISPDSLDGIVGSKGGAVQSFLKLQ